MRVFWALGIMVLTAATGGGANAAAPRFSDYSDYIVISVVPRSPSIEPVNSNRNAMKRPRCG